MADHSWLSVHIFYHGGLDRPLTGLVHPLLNELKAAGLGHEYFFLRYWDGGPHVRLRIRCASRWHPEVAQRVESVAGGFFAAQPAPDSLEQADYEPLAAELSRTEGVDPALPGLQPNNSLAYIPYRPELRRYARYSSIRVVERHFHESSRIVLPVIRDAVPMTVRTRAAMAFCLLAWFCVERDPPTLVDRLLRNADGSATDRHRSRVPNRKELVRTADQMRTLAEQAPELDGNGVLVAWARAVRRLTCELSDDPDVLDIVDACAHLACNRLGVDVRIERELRAAALTGIVGLLRSEE